MTEEARHDRVTPVTPEFSSVVRNLSLNPCPPTTPRASPDSEGGGWEWDEPESPSS